jgi:hypothetical protein
MIDTFVLIIAFSLIFSLLQIFSFLAIVRKRTFEIKDRLDSDEDWKGMLHMLTHLFAVDMMGLSSLPARVYNRYVDEMYVNMRII